MKLTEIISKCMVCGKEKPTGTYTSEPIDGTAYSHGYCSIECVRKQYQDEDFISLMIKGLEEEEK